MEFRPVNLAEIYGNIDAARANQAQMQNNAMMQERQRRQFAMEDEERQNKIRIRDAYKSSYDTVDGVPKLNQGRLLSSVLEIDPMQAATIEKEFNTREANNLEMMVKKAQYGRDVMVNVTPQTWGQTRQQLINQGFEFARNLPEQYDLNAHKASVMDADAFLAQNGIGSKGSSQEYIYQPTSGGILRLPKRDGGDVSYVIDPVTGKNAVQAPYDPALQGELSGSRTRATSNVDLEMKPQIKRAESTIDLEMQPQIVTAQETAKAKVGQQTEKTKNINTANKFLSVAQQAKDLLDKKPTGSGIGAMIDTAGRVVGMSSESAEAASQLETVAGWLVSNVPRMEGPQSNFDVENYRTMAGMIGDRTRPVSERKKALEAVVKLQEKYKSLNQETKTPNTTLKNIITLPDGRKLGINAQGKAELVK